MEVCNEIGPEVKNKIQPSSYKKIKNKVDKTSTILIQKTSISNNHTYNIKTPPKLEENH